MIDSKPYDDVLLLKTSMCKIAQKKRFQKRALLFPDDETLATTIVSHFKRITPYSMHYVYCRVIVIIIIIRVYLPI